MTKSAIRFWRQGYAKSTRTAYKRHFRRYGRWTAIRGITGDGVSERPQEADLIFFAVFEAKRKMSPGYIKAELSAIAAGTIANGFKDPLRDDNNRYLPHLRRVMRGISRTCSKARRKRKPLTTDKLAAVGKFARRVTGSVYNAACLKAALTLGVYALLRVSEMVSPKTTGHVPSKGMCVGDIEFLPSFELADRMVVTVKNSKSDPFRNGCDLKIFANGTETCPVAAMKQWLRCRGRRDEQGCLFKLSSGKLLTRPLLQKWMRAGLDLAGYKGEEHSTHSMRAGGAETLAAQGFDASTIQVLGRWASSAFLLYLKLGDSVRKQASKAMGRLKRQDVEFMADRDKAINDSEWR